MKKLMLVLSLIALSSSLTAPTFAQDIIVPKNHKGEAMTLAALAKDAAWRQKVTKQWKTSEANQKTRKLRYTKDSFYTEDNTQEASLYNSYSSQYIYN
ncbi:hypothetical protein [uncultured Kiloniella sp.]|uniref:hypothetical protein n=1 Tax=uncultured Kiloniella sp. TaxID=1133091 RepID=UPI002627B5FE|nr:hypothetical protein [uncultured Kiloniella sp.]